MTPGYQQKNGKIYINDRLYVPQDKEQQEQTIATCHDGPLEGHPGIKKTQELVKRQFWWLQMNKDIAEYVKGCILCQQNKSNQQK